jgi:transcriptional regulator with XRE-family HTH domain
MTVPISIRLRELREGKGMTQVALAERSGIPQATIWRIESGTQRIDLRVLEALADALGVDAALLIKHQRGEA